MSKRIVIVCLIMSILPSLLYSDWQIVRIDALKQDVSDAKIAMNSSGEAVVAFTQLDSVQSPPSRRLFVTLYNPALQTFTIPVIVDAGIDWDPNIFGVGIDEQGKVTVAFVQRSLLDSTDYLFLNQFIPGTGWTGAAPIFSVHWPGNLISLVYGDPKVGFLSIGAVVLFHYIDDNNIQNMVVYREPGNFDLIDVTSSPSGQKRFVLSTNRTNRACISYEIETFPYVRIYSSRFGYSLGSSWSSPELVDRGNLGENIKPSLSLDPDGNGFLTFGYNFAAVPDTLFVNILDTLSGWTGPVIIDSDAGDITESWDVDTDDSGNAMIVYNKWTSGLQGFGRYYQSGTGWSPPEIFTQGLGYSTNQKVSFDSTGNSGAIFNFGNQFSNGLVGANGFIPGTGWDIPDTVYGSLGPFVSNLDIKAYGEMNAVAIFIQQTDSSRLYAAIYTSPTAIEESRDVKDFPHIKLDQNYPNPFNPSTSIRYTISRKQFVTLKVYDLLGREVATLVHEEEPTGDYEVIFNGNGLGSGVYFYQLKAGNYIETKKMILNK